MMSTPILLLMVAVMAGAEAVPPVARTISASKGDVGIENVLPGATGGGGLLKSPKPDGSYFAAPGIVGGLFVKNISKFSQVVAIVGEDKRGGRSVHCSGVIIDKKVVMTVDIKKDTKTSKCGEIVSVFFPRRFNPKKVALGHDIAIVKLSRKITGPDAKRVKVSFAKPKNGLKAFSVGFGAEKLGLRFDGKLRSAAVKVVLNEGQCNALNRAGLGNDSDLICAMSNRAAICNGDSGGPLLVKTNKKNEYICVGIASLSRCAKGVPSVYSSLYDKDHAKIFKKMMKKLKGTYITGKLPKK